MDIVLIQPPAYDRRPSKRSQPPLGLTYVASFLLSKGLEVSIIDGSIGNQTVDSIVKRICDISPHVVGITTTCEDRFNAIGLCNKIKSKLKRTLVMVGGPHFSYSAEDALKNVPGIDVVVIGEGEYTAWEVIQNFLKSKNTHSFHNILGCAFRDEKGKVIINPRRLPIKNIDEIPVPAWHLFDMDKYQGTLSVEEKTRAIGIITSRGCPNQCIYCSNSLNRNIRFRDPKLVVDEIEFLQKKYGFKGVNIYDDSFTSDKEHVSKICREILKRKIKMRWYCRLRVNNVSLELLRLMKKAGCVALGYGVEIGSDRLLKIMKKGVTTEQIKDAVAMTSKVGFEHVVFFLMTSLPGQTLKDVITSVRFVRELRSMIEGKPVYEVHIGVPTRIYPGTEIEKIALENGNVFPKNFSWNRSYVSETSRLFETNRYVPHYEDPSLSLFKIKIYSLWIKLQMRALKLLRLPPEWL